MVSQGYAPGVLWCCPSGAEKWTNQVTQANAKTAVLGVAIWGWHWKWGNPHAFLCQNTQSNTIVGD